MEKYTYLLINLFSILIPLLVSFEKRIAYYKQWKFLFPSILITATFFIIWDHFLTVWGVWGFNPKYVIGVYLWELPIEEWLFFITIPYSCVFIYVSLNYIFKKDPLNRYAKNISLALIVIFTIIVLFNSSRLYTCIKLSLAALMLVYALKNNLVFMGMFYRAYMVSLLPFLVVNGFLTALPVVIYNNNENLGIRIGSIPVEDTIYTLLMLLMNITLFEYLKNRKTNSVINHVKSPGLH